MRRALGALTFACAALGCKLPAAHLRLVTRFGGRQQISARDRGVRFGAGTALVRRRRDRLHAQRPNPLPRTAWPDRFLHRANHSPMS
jgi:hypothetical protein